MPGNSKHGAIPPLARARQVAWLLLLSALFLLYCSLFFAAVDAAQQKIGNWAVLVWGLAFVISLIGPAALYFAWRAFRKLKPLNKGVFIPGSPPADGATVAVSGRIRAKGNILVSPLSQRECGAYRYQASWSRRYRRGNDDRTEKLVSVSGYGLARLELDHGGEKSLQIEALPELEECVSNQETGGELSENAFEFHDRLRAEKPEIPVGNGKETVDMRARLDQANRILEPPVTYHYLGPRAPDSSGLTTTEELLPLNETVTLIGVFEAQPHRLTGPMSAYLGPIHEVRKEVGKTAIQLGTVGAIISLIGAIMIIVPLLM